MKKNLALCMGGFCLLALFLITGCAKYPATNGWKPCQIERVVIPAGPLTAANLVTRAAHRRTPLKIPLASVSNSGIPDDTLNFTYNQWGNPVSIIHQYKYYADNALFRYDNWNRLSEYINVFPQMDGGDYWHRYKYDSIIPDRIVADTAYRDFEMTNGQLTYYHDIDLTIFQYDSLGRISQSTEIVIGDTIVRNYVYDANGNLQYPGATYDNKPNVRLTNKIWMFIDRNYSINNPTYNSTYTYNVTGFPVTINNSADQAPGLSFLTIDHDAIVRSFYYYSCP